jgi:hypothetical protein
MNQMTKQSLAVFMLGLVMGAAAMMIGRPNHAVAENTAWSPGLYQIHGSGTLRPGETNVWRLNTATGVLEFCSYANLSPAGTNRIACQTSNTPAAR